MRHLLIISILLFLFCSFRLKPECINEKDNFRIFPNSWTMLERDSIGYLVYAPCDGSTPKIYIEKDSTLILQWQLEKSEFKIKEITKTKNNIYLINCYGTFENNTLIANDQNIIFQIKLVDKKRNLYLWSWLTDFGEHLNIMDTTKWVMTPTKYVDKFRKIDNPCPTEMKVEKRFLPIEFNE